VFEEQADAVESAIVQNFVHVIVLELGQCSENVENIFIFVVLPDL
jgi:hypothetical protein